MKRYTDYFYIILSTLFVSIILLSCATPKNVKKINTRPNVTQSFMLLRPEYPVASVILFCGGDGDIQFSSATLGKKSRNFLVRTRNTFLKNDFIVAVIDAPSDKSQKSGLNAYNTKKGHTFRGSKKHATDIEAVANYLKSVEDVPVWLVGTSSGTVSATNGVIRIENAIDGLVLASPITKTDESWPIHNNRPNGILDMELQKIDVPTLIVSHKNDQCEYTPPKDAKKITKKIKLPSHIVEVVYFDGGSTPRSKPCQAMSKHGFIGIEDDVVTTISKFIRNN